MGTYGLGDCRPLSNDSLLHVWELGQTRHPVDRALTILAAVFPEVAPDDLAALPVGQRDAHLLTVYARMFGPHLAGLAQCPDCQASLEFAFTINDIRAEPPSEPHGPAYDLTIGDVAVRFRLPNSFDLATVVHLGHRSPSIEAARDLLLERCVLEVSHASEAIALAELPEATVAALIDQMSQCDPQADVVIDFHCPQCDQDWEAHFDIVTFLWTRISTQAVNLLRDIHLLARAYGWREAEILSLHPMRRQSYLNMVI